MKSFIFLFITIFGIGMSFGKEDPRIEKFRSLPASEALLLYRNTAEPPELKAEMTRSILHDKRMDLISSIFMDHGSFGELLKASKGVQDSQLRDQIVLLMLRTDSPFWYRPEPQLASDGSSGVQFENVVEPFVGVITKYLPSLSITEGLFATKENRLGLAANLELAMSKDGLDPLPERPKKRFGPNGRLMDESSRNDGGSASAASPVIDEMGFQSQAFVGRTLAFIALAFCFLVIGWVLLGNSKKS